MSNRAAQPDFDVATIMGGLYGDGIIGAKRAFDRVWADRLHDDVLALFREAVQRPGGAVGRGPNRYYVEIHPQRIRGFVELATHPWVVAVSRATLGTTSRSWKSASTSRCPAPPISRGIAIFPRLRPRCGVGG